MAERLRYSIDVETDWGGRTNTVQGLKEGLPFILELFRSHQVKAIFFVSTELLRYYHRDIAAIKEHGHQIGNHSHFHHVFKNVDRQHQNKEIGEQLLRAYSLVPTGPIPFRAPRFSLKTKDQYSFRFRHVGLLRHVYGLDRKILPADTIYLHPFDIVKPTTPAPNLFCKLWYSQGERAKAMLTKIVRIEYENSINKRT
ncbi:MAG TPA: polysaccharide deacetylase family protein [Nitrososphaera sp.]|nr:polysaccharide deacetylase family protein [Nitrososphaera sp.]